MNEEMTEEEASREKINLIGAVEALAEFANVVFKANVTEQEKEHWARLIALLCENEIDILSLMKNINEMTPEDLDKYEELKEPLLKLRTILKK